MNSASRGQRLYLHIGCGKTGSSALQLWLHRYREAFEKAGFFYPFGEGRDPGEYEITSGNGKLLIDALEAHRAQAYLQKLFRQYSRIIFSSEAFQGIEGKNLKALRELQEKLGFDITVIVYVRDLYDVLYSLYHQRIKRHLETESFEHFIRQTKIVQQFHVLRRYEKFFDQIEVLHYDSEKERGLDRAFCRALGIDDGRIPPMASRKVNRSLSVFEAELLRRMNGLFLGHCPPDSEFSRELSDTLIYANPEKETEIYFDPKLLQVLRKRFSKEIGRINRRYFGGKTLKLFDRSGKKLVRKLPEIPQEYLLVSELLIDKYCRASQNRRSLPGLGRLLKQVY